MRECAESTQRYMLSTIKMFTMNAIGVVRLSYRC